ncbi:MAG: peptidoglycan DD-metalloendopeptidase family protein, partial [Sphingobium sp.]
DDTPLRIRGRVGGSLYASARAAGADPSTIQSYLKAIASQVSLGTGVGADDRFDIVVAHRRAATGETETGKLLFAGLERSGGKRVDMLRWTIDGQEQWFEASGVGQRRGMMAAPVAGHLTSSFGMRFHPILGYSRMHAGVDFGARWGSPIYAANSGRVVFAGRHGGHGNYVKIDHGGGIGTGYGHMSRIAAYAGEMVRQGQVIGYVGSTGLSTGPHLHYEVYRGGVPINPLSLKFTQTAQLSGAALSAFRARLVSLRSLPVGLPAVSFASAGAGQQNRAR